MLTSPHRREQSRCRSIHCRPKSCTFPLRIINQSKLANAVAPQVRQSTHHVMLKSLLQYPITRPVSLGIGFNITIIVLGTAWVALVTVFNVATVRYEIVPITYTQFNASYTLWYERFRPFLSWLSTPRICNGSYISLNEGVHQGCYINSEAVSTNIGGFSYTLEDYIDEGTTSGKLTLEFRHEKCGKGWKAENTGSSSFKYICFRNTRNRF